MNQRELRGPQKGELKRRGANPKISVVVPSVSVLYAIESMGPLPKRSLYKLF